MAAPFDFSQAYLLNCRRYYLDDSFSVQSHGPSCDRWDRAATQLTQLDFEPNVSNSFTTPALIIYI